MEDPVITVAEWNALTTTIHEYVKRYGLLNVQEAIIRETVICEASAYGRGNTAHKLEGLN